MHNLNDSYRFRLRPQLGKKTESDCWYSLPSVHEKGVNIAKKDSSNTIKLPNDETKKNKQKKNL